VFKKQPLKQAPLMALIPMTGMQIAGTALSLAGGLAQSSAMKSAAKANQAQLNYAAGQTEAAGQHKAEQDRRKAELMLSRAMAVGAASGAGTSGMEGILAGIAGEGEKQAQATMYESTERAKGLRYQGAVGVAEAKQKAKATLLGAFGSAAMSIAGRYAPSAPPTDFSSTANRGFNSANGFVPGFDSQSEYDYIMGN
jgi:hypothetical protein